MNHGTRIFAGIAAALALLLPPTLPAAHPLITEDTSTLGKGGAQLELGTEHITIRSGEIEQYSVLTTTVLGYGLSDRADLLLTAPYLRIGDVAVLGTPGARGFADLGVDIKWRFYERDRLSFAVKPGITFPTGNDDLGLGGGRTAWTLYLVSGYQLEKWEFLLHLGHIHHNNVLSERVDLWHASTAVTWQATEKLKLILDVGIDRNTEPHAKADPVFAIGGLIYSPVENFDLDVGYRTIALDGTQIKVLLAGLTLRW